MDIDISIVIPTKNRGKYAVHTVMACLAIVGKTQIILADSSDNNLLYDELVNNDILNKITYVKTSSEFTIVDNFNYAINLAIGDYVVFIGDDDVITPEIVNITHYAKLNEIDCVNFTFPVTYWWPDFIHRRSGTKNAGSLLVNTYSKEINILNALKTLSDASLILGSGPHNMPRLYCGLVSNKLIKSLLNKYGSIFGGVSPDVYSSVLLASECNNFIRYDYPVIIPGISGGSGSGSSSNGTHVGDLYNNKHISSFHNLKWDKRIPEFYSVTNVWAYSMLKALERINRDSLANLLSVYIKCILYHPSYFAKTLKAFNIYGKININNLFSSLFFELFYFSSVIINRFKKIFYKNNFMLIKNISNTYCAFYVFTSNKYK